MNTANRIEDYPMYGKWPALVGVTVLLQAMCGAWGIKPEDLKREDRTRDTASKRMIFWLIAHERYPDILYKQLARLTGRSSHAGVIRGIQRAKDLLYVDDPKLLEYYDKVKHYIHA